MPSDRFRGSTPTYSPVFSVSDISIAAHCTTPLSASSYPRSSSIRGAASNASHRSPPIPDVGAIQTQDVEAWIATNDFDRACSSGWSGAGVERGKEDECQGRHRHYSSANQFVFWKSLEIPLRVFCRALPKRPVTWWSGIGWCDELRIQEAKYTRLVKTMLREMEPDTYK